MSCEMLVSYRPLASQGRELPRRRYETVALRSCQCPTTRCCGSACCEAARRCGPSEPQRLHQRPHRSRRGARDISIGAATTTRRPRRPPHRPARASSKFLIRTRTTGAASPLLLTASSTARRASSTATQLLRAGESPQTPSISRATATTRARASANAQHGRRARRRRSARGSLSDPQLRRRPRARCRASLPLGGRGEGSSRMGARCPLCPTVG